MTTFTELSHLLSGWIRWLRFRRGAAWALRGLSLGLACALILGLIGLAQTRLLRAEFLSLVAALALTGLLAAGLGAVFWPVSRLKAARVFDLEFHLDERVSTALELERERGRHPAEMLQKQLDDAVIAARTVRPRRDLPLRLRPAEALLALALVLLLGVLWTRGETWFQAAQQARNVQQAVAGQAETIEKILKQVEANPSLTAEQKKALSAPLEQALNQLQGNPSLESSVSTLTSAGEKLQALADPQAGQTAQALQQAGTQLAKQEGSPLQSVGEQLAQGNLLAAASALAGTDLSQLSPQAAAQTAAQLEQLAQNLQAADPQLAGQLNQAAQALKNGDTAAAQQALSQAAQSMAQAGQQQALAQAAGQAAQQMQQGAGQVIAAGGGQQPGQPGQTAGQSPGASQNPQPGASAGAGSGKGTGQSPQTGGQEAGSAPIPQNNGAGDGGETSYEQIYAPTLLGGEGGPQVGLTNPPGQNGEVIGQGPTTPGDPGQSLVPYTQVLTQYEQVNRQAIENGEIPFEFTQVIRSYFDALKP
jgi:hypothetical protein